MRKTVSDLWNDIFSDYDILNEINRAGWFKIKADDIRTYKEPRLMTKFDFSSQLPEIFKNNNLGILPINNGEYIIGKYDLFKNISSSKYEDIEPIKMSLPRFIETIDPDNIYSESNALNVALLSGMIKDAVGEEVVETIQGKMRATGFSFEIDGENGKCKIDIERPAMEIDGGYEGEECVVLIEAKNYLPKDFIIRQLYFPYRHWFDKVNKPIIPIFFAYDNGIYTFFIYKFSDLYNYNSLELVNIKRYILKNEDADTIKKNILNSVELVEELPQSEIPFPQADSFNRVLGIVDMVSSDINNASDIAEEYGFDVRQGSYYISACKYLDLITPSDKTGEYKLSSKGFMITNLDMRSRNEMLIKKILSHKVFYYTYKYYVDNNVMPSKDIIISFMKEYSDITNSETLNRRSSTVRGWIEWIIGCQV